MPIFYLLIKSGLFSFLNRFSASIAVNEKNSIDKKIDFILGSFIVMSPLFLFILYSETIKNNKKILFYYFFYIFNLYLIHFFDILHLKDLSVENFQKKNIFSDYFIR